LTSVIFSCTEESVEPKEAKETENVEILPPRTITQPLDLDSLECLEWLSNTEPEIFMIVEPPTFPEFDEDGKKYLSVSKGEEFLQYINSQMVYPSEAIEKKIEGRVILKFIIQPDGKITNAYVARGLGAGCDEEALRILNTIRFSPQRRSRGKPVPSHFTIPIQFKLDSEKSP